jgi:DNA-binding NarL/FixJ family response regulator
VSTTKKKTRILIADPEGVFRLGLKKLFGVEDDLLVVAQADKSGQITGLATKFKPDVLFVQVEMLGENPLEFMTRLRQVSAEGRVVAVVPAVMSLESGHLAKAGLAGALSRSTAPEDFVKSARKVMKNDLWPPKPPAVTSVAAQPGSHETARRPADTLTRRERSIIACLVQGWRNKEIAERLDISEQTVKNHLRAVYDKIGVSDRLELVLYAIHQKLDLPPVPQAEPSVSVVS